MEPHDDVILVATDDLRVGPGRTRDLATLADLELDIVHNRADRDIAERHGVARLYVDVLAGNDGVALREPLRRQDVGQLAVLVLDQRDESGPIGIVFDPLHGRRRVKLAALEVDLAVGLLVAAAAESHHGAAGIVAPARRALANGQRLDRRAAIKAGAVDEHELALARRRGII